MFCWAYLSFLFFLFLGKCKLHHLVLINKCITHLHNTYNAKCIPSSLTQWLLTAEQKSMYNAVASSSPLFKVSFLPRHPGTLHPALRSRRRAARVWRVNASCHTSLSKHVKGSLIPLLAQFAPVRLSWCASRFFLDFRRGLLTWNQREASQCLLGVPGRNKR